MILPSYSIIKISSRINTSNKIAILLHSKTKRPHTCKSEHRILYSIFKNIGTGLLHMMFLLTRNKKACQLIIGFRDPGIRRLKEFIVIGERTMNSKQIRNVYTIPQQLNSTYLCFMGDYPFAVVSLQKTHDEWTKYLQGDLSSDTECFLLDVYQRYLDDKNVADDTTCASLNLPRIFSTLCKSLTQDCDESICAGNKHSIDILHSSLLHEHSGYQTSCYLQSVIIVCDHIL
ncbi:hypothetical protein BDB01DRAFT_836032 [Pilobolus umbonatus]|nr:hypothetical protein BDB01DRAFT_836032 [Pilobolus umbonatus]